MRLVFHEDLHELFPEKSYELEASTPLDALKLLAENHPLVGKMKPKPVKIKQIRDFALAHDSTLQSKTFEVIPVDKEEVNTNFYSGAGGNNPIVTIIIGIVLIVLIVVTGGAAGAAAAAAASGASAATAAAVSTAVSVALSMGVSLVLAGLMQLLAPKPKDAEGNKSSRKFGTTSTTELGTPIQIIFGLHRAYFQLISFNVDSRKYNGVDQPNKSPYFKKKVDQHMPEGNIDRFYGIYQAGDKTKILQVDNVKNRTGLED